jgi:hypothetical protein
MPIDALKKGDRMKEIKSSLRFNRLQKEER